MPSRPDDLPFDLRALTIFLAACEEGGMAAAARRLGLTQPAISSAVADLEARLGAALFDRSVRPLALTPAGALLRQRASALVSEARQIAPGLSEIARGRLPLVRIGLVDSLSRALSAPLAEHLRGRAEEVSIRSGLTAAHAGALVTRNLEVMIGADDLGDLDGVERWPIAGETYVLSLPLGVVAPRSTAELMTLARELTFVRYSARSSTGVEIDRHLRRLGVELPRGLEFDTPYGVAATVAAGGGFALTTPLCAYESGVDLSRIGFAPTPGPQATRRITLVALARSLGRLPARLAEFARTELRATALPPIERASPALAAAIEVS
ncbi:LysR family transcriptional regulator [Chenggangzhangella methanolivorans]|uniref:LysR family transcriptional regulator n=1 Tax=Chenggangzhangella methanolivorans TaxID=1437009 RepID=A0A9E6URE3_9HYPH|nr:LysR family transcriptional regulator [Chenggangzhangella methanolivorans]QZO02180.1 LysR family transcriptional regulator [Chenggangzhangella methanolivorans]